jgi:hypothetical protein
MTLKAPRRPIIAVVRAGRRGTQTPGCDCMATRRRTRTIIAAPLPGAQLRTGEPGRTAAAKGVTAFPRTQAALKSRERQIHRRRRFSFHGQRSSGRWSPRGNHPRQPSDQNQTLNGPK